MMLRRTLTALAALLLILIGVLTVNTLRFTPVAQPNLPPLAVRDDPAAVQRLAEAVRIPTVSRENAPTDTAAFAAFHAKLAKDFPLVHATLKLETVATSSLLFTWTGTDPSLPPLLLLAHQDVVPVEAGSEGRWTHPPFSGAIADGAVWGRGSLDDKGMLMSVLEAVERKRAAGWQPRRTVILAFGHDEEIGGGGAKVIAALLKSRRVKPLLVLDEGLAVTDGIIPGVAKPVALVGTAEKGYVTVEFTARAPGGHSSTPSPDNAIVSLSRAMTRLGDNPFPARLDAPMADTFASVGPHMGLGARVAFANLWLTEPLILRQLTGATATAASVRTSTAPTIFHAGTKDNVLPQTARASVNHRILPGDTVAGVVARDRATVDDSRIEVRPRPGAREPTPVSPTGEPAFAALRRAILRAYPDAIVAPALTLGGTDSRNYGELTPAIFRFSPMVVRARDLERIHGTDERMIIADYLRAIAFYEAMLEESAGR